MWYTHTRPHEKYAESKTKVNLLFKELHKKGYVTRQNFSCCGSCAAYELGEYFSKKGIPEGNERKAVTYNRQSAESFKRTANLYLSWGGNGKEIVDTAHALGITCDWDGSESTRIRLVFAL